MRCIRVQIGQKPLPVYKEKVFVMWKTVLYLMLNYVKNIKH